MIAAALGVSRYKTPLDAYLDVRGEAADIEETPDMERGNFLEPAIMAWAGKRLDRQWEKPHLSLVHPEQPMFTYSPDGLEVQEGPGLLEVKAPGPYTAHEWGEQGTDQVPVEYLMQGAWGLAITGRKTCFFAALIGGELRIFKHERDMELEGKMLARASSFIVDHVLAAVPPPAQYGDDLRKIYPRATTEAYLAWNDLNPVQQQTIADFLRLYAIEKQAATEKESRQVLVEDIIRTAPGIQGLPPELGFERIDWKEAKPAMHAGSWKNLATEELLSKLGPGEQKHLIEQYTPATGSRRFTPIKTKAQR